MRIPVAFALLVVAGSAVAFTTVAPSPAIARRATPTPAPTATPLPPEDPAATKTARQLFVTWQIGVVDTKRYAPILKQLASPDQVSGTAAQLAQLGSLNAMDWLGYRQLPGLAPGTLVYLYKANCADGAVFIMFAVQPDGLIAALHFAQTPEDLPDALGNTPEPSGSPSAPPG